MAYKYDVKTSIKDNKSMVNLTICHILFAIINLFTSTFLVAHIYSLTGEIYQYIRHVALFEMSAYIFMLITLRLLSIVVDKTNRIGVYIVSNIINAALVILLIFLGKQLASMVILAGALRGVAHGAYYASYNVLKHEMVSRKTMKKYTAVIQIFSQLVSIVFPIVLGSLIEISTFSMVAIYVFILAVIQVVLCCFIKAKKPDGSNFNLKEYKKRLDKNPELKARIKFLYFTSILYGATTVANILCDVCIMLQFGSTFSFGAITSVLAFINIASIIVVSKLTVPGKRSLMFIFVSIIPILGVVLFIAMPNITTVIIYNILTEITHAIYKVIFDHYRNSSLKEFGFYEDIAEHQTMVEDILQIVRIITYCLLFAISFIESVVVFKISLVIFTLSFSGVTLMLMIYEKKFCKNEEIKKH